MSRSLLKKNKDNHELLNSNSSSVVRYVSPKIAFKKLHVHQILFGDNFDVKKLRSKRYHCGKFIFDLAKTKLSLANYSIKCLKSIELRNASVNEPGMLPITLRGLTRIGSFAICFSHENFYVQGEVTVELVLKHLRCNLSSIKIATSYIGEDNDECLKLLFVKHVFPCIRVMNNLKILCMNPIDSEFCWQNRRLESIKPLSLKQKELLQVSQKKLRRAKNIENITFLCSCTLNDFYIQLIQQFFVLSNLKVLQLMHLDPSLVNIVLKSFRESQSLSRVIFYLDLDLTETLHVTSKGLNTAYEWIAYMTQLKTLKGVVELPFVTLTCLNLSIEAYHEGIFNPEWQNCHSIKFNGITSLHLSLNYNTGTSTAPKKPISIITPIAREVKRQKSLVELTLRMAVSSKEILAKEINLLKAQENLRRVSLLFKVCPVKKHIPGLLEALKSLKSFVSKNQHLTHFALFFEILAPQYFISLRNVIASLSELDLLVIGYVNSERHGKSHEEILVELKKVFEVKKVIKKVMIITECSPNGEEDCIRHQVDVRNAVMLNSNIKECAFEGRSNIEILLYNGIV